MWILDFLRHSCEIYHAVSQEIMPCLVLFPFYVSPGNDFTSFFLSFPREMWDEDRMMSRAKSKHFSFGLKFDC